MAAISGQRTFPLPEPQSRIRPESAASMRWRSASLSLTSASLDSACRRAWVQLPPSLHGPPKECKYRLGDSLKGLQPYIRAICAGNAAAHDGYLRSGLLSISRTQGTGIRLEYPRPGLTFNSSLCLWQALLQNGSTQLFINSGVWLQLRHMVAVSAGFHLTWSKSAPLARIAQTARAILLANATTTTL